MDIDFWASRIRPAKHLSAVYALSRHSDNGVVLDDSDGDDDARACFPCPFCYVEIEVPVLCSHLQEEHCFDVKNAVCPLCAGNLGKDATGHFIAQHANSLKRRRKCEKSGSSVAHVKKLPTTGRGRKIASAADPLLSPFICGIQFSKSKDDRKDECSGTDDSVAADMKSEPCLLEEDHQDYEERKLRAAFVQQMITSTVFQN